MPLLLQMLAFASSAKCMHCWFSMNSFGYKEVELSTCAGEELQDTYTEGNPASELPWASIHHLNKRGEALQAVDVTDVLLLTVYSHSISWYWSQHTCAKAEGWSVMQMLWNVRDFTAVVLQMWSTLTCAGIFDKRTPCYCHGVCSWRRLVPTCDCTQTTLSVARRSSSVDLSAVTHWTGLLP